MLDTKEMVHIIAKTCDEKQAEEIIVLDMENISLVADCFLICHASNPRQVQAIAKAVKEVMEDNDVAISHMEGYDQGKWIIIDTGFVLCHIFQEEERSFYNLERLWGDANRIPLQIGHEE